MSDACRRPGESSAVSMLPATLSLLCELTAAWLLAPSGSAENRQPRVEAEAEGRNPRRLRSVVCRLPDSFVLAGSDPT
jgi:hypothetical protein